jgi:hypothetical protein
VDAGRSDCFAQILTFEDLCQSESRFVNVTSSPDFLTMTFGLGVKQPTNLLKEKE